MRSFILAAIVLAFATSVNAKDNGDDCNGRGSCGGTTTNNITNQGGQGGAGGNASANATGGNAAVVGSGNSNVKTYNDIRNTNMQGQAQGQKQGQAQGQLQGQGQSQNASANNAGNKQSTSVTINEGDNPKQATSGPGIASSPSATCRIAVGLSVGGTFGGVGGFGSVEDANCVRNEKVRMLKEVLNRPDAAKALACKDADMAEAMGDCKPGTTAAVEPTVVGSTTRTSYDPFSTAPQQR